MGFGKLWQNKILYVANLKNKMGGASSSTRKLTVENDDPTSVIKVSEEVVDRLRGNQVVRNVPAQAPQQHAGQFPIFLSDPVLNSQQIQQITAGELRKNDDYWQKRLWNLEEKHKKMNQVMDEEYKKAMDEFTIKKIEINKKLPPCKATERAVKDCYLEYPNEPMRCAKVVQAFQECVDSKRNKLLASRG